MLVNTEGIILKQTKTVGGRRMVLLFSKKYGKISAGTTIDEKGKSKAALAMRPFTYGNYEIFKNKEYYNINSADVIKSYYKIGEDVDKYMSSSFVLELTERMLYEEQPNPQLFNLLIDFFTCIEQRNKEYQTLVLAYEIKALKIMGTMPELDQCASCGAKDDLIDFSVAQGGMICKECAKNNRNQDNDTLIYRVDFGIVDILKYFVKNPLESFGKIALEEKVSGELQTIIKSYMSYYLDIGKLKSESFFMGKY
ncbi:MAG: DNA repair protein RecO [Anaerovoracaceae bacterium]